MGDVVNTEDVEIENISNSDAIDVNILNDSNSQNELHDQDYSLANEKNDNIFLGYVSYRPERMLHYRPINNASSSIMGISALQELDIKFDSKVNDSNIGADTQYSRHSLEPLTSSYSINLTSPVLIFSKSFSGQPLIKDSSTTLLTSLLSNRNKKMSKLDKLLVNTDYQSYGGSNAGEMFIGLQKTGFTSNTAYTGGLDGITVYDDNFYTYKLYGSNPDRPRLFESKQTIVDTDINFESSDIINYNDNRLSKYVKPIQIGNRNAITLASKNRSQSKSHDNPEQVELLISSDFNSPDRIIIKQNPISYNSDLVMLIDEEYENYRDLFETDTYSTDEIFGIRANLALSDYLDPLDSIVNDSYAEYYKITSKDYSDSSTNYNQSTEPLTDTAYFEINDIGLSSVNVSMSHSNSGSFNMVDDASNYEPAISDLLKRISESFVDSTETIDSTKSSYAKTTNKIVTTDTSGRQSLEPADLINIDLDSETTEIVSSLGTDPHRHSKENIYFESLAFIGIQDADESDDSDIMNLCQVQSSRSQ